MAVAERIESLRAKHSALDRRILDASLQPYHDENEIARMKREKLRLKDEIARLAAHDA